MIGINHPMLALKRKENRLIWKMIKIMMTKEEFSRTNWKMSYEQYQKCYCPECSKKGCQHRNAYRRVPSIDGGLTLCPKLRSDK